MTQITVADWHERRADEYDEVALGNKAAHCWGVRSGAPEGRRAVLVTLFTDIGEPSPDATEAIASTAPLVDVSPEEVIYLGLLSRQRAQREADALRTGAPGGSVGY